jgi:SAM-dependent methyltransferase
MVRSREVRRAWWLRVSRPANLFQPYNDTWSDRYPEVFDLLRGAIPDGPDVRLLSFGCSVGDEVFTLREYFPEATLVGIDISRGNIATCRRRARTGGDERMHFIRAGTVGHRPHGHYDAVLCMAVLRHGDLGATRATSCEHRITFDSFDSTVRELARCLEVGGLLAIGNSNFRFCDTSSAERFDIVDCRSAPSERGATPLFGPDNLLLADQEYREVVFRKRW